MGVAKINHLGWPGFKTVGTGPGGEQNRNVHMPAADLLHKIFLRRDADNHIDPVLRGISG